VLLQIAANEDDCTSVASLLEDARAQLPSLEDEVDTLAAALSGVCPN
jgi:hypothetical protein